MGKEAKYVVRQQFVEEGLEASLCRKPATNRHYRKLDGDQAVPPTADSRQAHAGQRSCRLGILAKHRSMSYRLAFHHSRRSN